MQMRTLFLALAFGLTASAATAQDSTLVKVGPRITTNDGLRIKFDADGSKYLKINIWSQTWVRDIENNPGTAVNGNPESHTLDAGFRRMRIQMFGQMSPRFLLMLQMGANNQSFATGGGSGTGANGTGKRAQFYFHDAYGQFNILQEKNAFTKKDNKVSLAVGVGLHSWAGVSRITNASTISILTADLPIFNWPTIEIADQLTRMFGVYGKGNIGKLGYRVSINKPFLTATAPVLGGPAVDNNKGNKLSYNGYFSYQFFDKDEISSAFLAGSYYGKKRVLNIGAGFLNSPNSTMTQPEKGVFKSYPIQTYGADIFYDAPVGNRKKDMVFTFYSVWYNYDFGPDYIRTTAVMNPGTADTSFTGTKAMEGYGSARFLMGTGNIWYTQTAFLLPRFSSKIRIQPYLIYTLKDLKALNQPGHYYNVGANFLFEGNNAKISLEYGSRPLYQASDKKVFSRAGEILAAIQFWL
jgi:hypothetical protein